MTISIQKEMFTRFTTPTTQTRRISDAIARKTNNKLVALNTATNWVTTNIKYKEDKYTSGQAEFFQSPDDTLRTRLGDCEDGSALISAIMNGLPNILKPEYSRVTIGRVVGITRSYHAWNETRIGRYSYIADWTSGKVHKEPNFGYQKMIAIYPYGLVILKGL